MRIGVIFTLTALQGAPVRLKLAAKLRAAGCPASQSEAECKYGHGCWAAEDRPVVVHPLLLHSWEGDRAPTGM